MIRSIEPGPPCPTCHQPAIAAMAHGFLRSSRPTCPACGAALAGPPALAPSTLASEPTAPAGPEPYERALRLLDAGAAILAELREDYRVRMRALMDAGDQSGALMLAMQLAGLRAPLDERIDALGGLCDDAREASRMLDRFAAPPAAPADELAALETPVAHTEPPAASPEPPRGKGKR